MRRTNRLGCIGPWGGVLPPIETEDSKWMPRQSSNATPEHARCLIALITYGGIVCVRNAYEVPSNGGIYVENMGAIVPALHSSGVRHVTTTRTLSRCRSRRIHVIKGPWRTFDPYPNFMVDLVKRDFEVAYAAALKVPSKQAHVRAGRHDFGTAETTTFEDAVTMHRDAAGVHRDWTASRVRDIAAMIGVTTDELATLIAFPRGLMRNFLSAEASMLLPHTVQLWLFHFEQLFAHARFGKRPVSMFPEGLLDDRLRRDGADGDERRTAPQGIRGVGR